MWDFGQTDYKNTITPSLPEAALGLERTLGAWQVQPAPFMEEDIGHKEVNGLLQVVCFYSLHPQASVHSQHRSYNDPLKIQSGFVTVCLNTLQGLPIFLGVTPMSLRWPTKPSTSPRHPRLFTPLHFPPLSTSLPVSARLVSLPHTISTSEPPLGLTLCLRALPTKSTWLTPSTPQVSAQKPPSSK